MREESIFLYLLCFFSIKFDYGFRKKAENKKNSMSKNEGYKYIAKFEKSLSENLFLNKLLS